MCGGEPRDALSVVRDGCAVGSRGRVVDLNTVVIGAFVEGLVPVGDINGVAEHGHAAELLRRFRHATHRAEAERVERAQRRRV